MEQEHRREDVSIKYLVIFCSNKTDLLRQFITCVDHFTLEIKEQSKQWTKRGVSAPKKAKTVPSAGKIFWDAHRIIFIDYL